MSAARSISRDFYRTGKAILAGNIFLRIPDTIKSGKFVVSMFDGPSVVVRHDGKMIAGAYLSSSTIDGIADLEFMEKCGHSVNVNASISSSSGWNSTKRSVPPPVPVYCKRKESKTMNWLPIEEYDKLKKSQRM